MNVSQQLSHYRRKPETLSIIGQWEFTIKLRDKAKSDFLGKRSSLSRHPTDPHELIELSWVDSKIGLNRLYVLDSIIALAESGLWKQVGLTLASRPIKYHEAVNNLVVSTGERKKCFTAVYVSKPWLVRVTRDKMYTRFVDAPKVLYSSTCMMHMMAKANLYNIKSLQIDDRGRKLPAFF